MNPTTPAEARALEAKAMTEREFQKQVIELAKGFDWLVAHFRPGMTSRISKQGKPVWVTPMQGDPGFPDLVLVHPEQQRVIVAELKSERGKCSLAQTQWLEAFDATGQVEVKIWRPSDWDAIVEELKW